MNGGAAGDSRCQRSSSTSLPHRVSTLHFLAFSSPLFHSYSYLLFPPRLRHHLLSTLTITFLFLYFYFSLSFFSLSLFVTHSSFLYFLSSFIVFGSLSVSLHCNLHHRHRAITRRFVGIYFILESCYRHLHTVTRLERRSWSLHTDHPRIVYMIFSLLFILYLLLIVKF